MAFISGNLSLEDQAIGGLLRCWSYVTLDSISAVASRGYFPAASQVQTGDLVDVISTDSIDPASRTTAEQASLIIEYI